MNFFQKPGNFGLLLILMLSGCGFDEGFQFSEQGREVPHFSAESAKNYIKEQVDFGPRVPGSDAHKQALNYFREHFQHTAGERNVFIQKFTQVVYGDTLEMANLLASFGPQHSDRILLAAHWDSRPRAEEDLIDQDSPILGADDGGSGVGLLMQLANIFAEHDVPVGIDIILFDGEDYGKVSDLQHYFLGARHWGNNPPVPGYSPRFGILLDMVGGENAVFPKEGHSMQFAPNLVDEIWSIASRKGYSPPFSNQRGARIADDHIIVHQTTGIPMINIIHHRTGDQGQAQFPPYWHTHDDNMDIIHTETLRAVGEVLLELIYNRIPT